MKTFKSLFILLMMIIASVSCSSVKLSNPDVSDCNIDLYDKKVLSYKDTTTGYLFEYLDGFKVYTTISDSLTEFKAVSKGGAFQHGVTIITINPNNKREKQIEKYFSDDSTNIDLKEWRLIHDSKLNRDIKFANGTATRKLNENMVIKGLTAVDVYEFPRSDKVFIVRAIDFCSISTSNKIERIFSLNRSKNL